MEQCAGAITIGQKGFSGLSFRPVRGLWPGQVIRSAPRGMCEVLATRLRSRDGVVGRSVERHVLCLVGGAQGGVQAVGDVDQVEQSSPDVGEADAHDYPDLPIPPSDRPFERPVHGEVG